MIILEFKAYGKKAQYQCIDEAIRTTKFVRNSCLCLWMDNKGLSKYDLNKYCKTLAKNFPFANELNSTARQAAAERAWSSIARFFENCKKKVPGKKGFPKFQKYCRFGKADATRTVEYKQSGWKLSPDQKSIVFSDKKGIGKLKLKGTWDLWRFDNKLIKRVRIVKRADGYYVQFCLSVDIKEQLEPADATVGLDVGLKEFYTDSRGKTEPNPRFYRAGEKRLKFYQRRVSRKKKGSSNRNKAVNRLGRHHLKISRQREEHAKRLARCVIRSNDLVAYEDLRVKNLVKNHCVAKSINDAGWYQFRKWLEHFGTKFGRVTVAVNPAYTSQNCSECGEVVKKSLSTRTHICKCGCKLDRDHNAAVNILNRALGTVGHTETWIDRRSRYANIDPNASGDLTSTVLGSGQGQQVESLSEESPRL